MSDTQVLTLDQILVGAHYRLLPGAFVNSNLTDDVPDLSGYVDEDFKGGLPDVRVRNIARSTGNVTIARPDGHIQVVHRSYLAPLDPVRPIETDEDALRRQMADNALLISQHFYRAAREQNWCSGAEEVIQQLNRELVGQQLIEDRNDYRLVVERRFRVSRQVRFTVWGQVSYEFTATDEEEAVNKEWEVSNAHFRQAALEGVRNGNWEVDDDSDADDNVEAELI
jgi:hypothetical protein